MLAAGIQAGALRRDRLARRLRAAMTTCFNGFGVVEVVMAEDEPMTILSSGDR